MFLPLAVATMSFVPGAMAIFMSGWLSLVQRRSAAFLMRAENCQSLTSSMLWPAGKR
jgi:hypothetical protein